MSMEFELHNVALKAGDRLKVKGLILRDAERFSLNLGWDADNLALHFSPRFHDVEDKSTLVCNSRMEGFWAVAERRHNPLQRGSEVKIVVKMTKDTFTVELPGGEEVHFSNQDIRDTMSYVSIGGDFRLKSFQILKDLEFVKSSGS